MRKNPLDEILQDMRRLGRNAPGWPTFPGYEVIEDLGEGGFGVVYRARDLTIEREVALKVLRPRPEPDQAAEQRFLNEARALARVRHPNVLVLYGVIEHEGSRALSLELIHGEPLGRAVQENGPLEPRDAVRAAIDVAHALAAVHSAGIVHRDVKTSNVLRECGGRIVLGDFGLGAFLAHGSPQGGKAYAAGAPAFMAPEQVRGDPVDPRTDVYSLGVLLHHLLSGELPFQGPDVGSTFQQILGGKAKPLSVARPGLSPCLLAAVTRAMDLDPGRRFQSAAEMAEELESCMDTMEEGATAGTRRRFSAIALAAGAVITAAALVAAWVSSSTPPGPATSVRMDAALRIVSGDGSLLRPGTPTSSRARLALDMGANGDLHVYLVELDARGRHYLLFPGVGEVRNPLPAGKRHRIPGVTGWLLPVDGERSSLILIASLGAVGPLEDAVLPRGASEETGKDGYPRLKPVTLRGLQRVLAANGYGRAQPTGEGGSDLGLRDLAEPIGKDRVKAEISGLWIGKIALTAD